jgi:PIN domain nuclease of toxin-antitoxin system
LPEAAAGAIASGDNNALVSAASIWEIAIKKAAGRLSAPDDLVEALDDSDMRTLSITAHHALGAGRLPMHHADPFDRMLISQSQSERLVLVTVDARFGDYEVDLLALG